MLAAPAPYAQKRLGYLNRKLVFLTLWTFKGFLWQNRLKLKELYVRKELKRAVAA
jgi:hypothetical protein